jgi:hypothetical protein
MLEWPLGGALCMGGGMVFDQAGGPRLNVRAPLAQAGGGDQVQNSQQPYETNDQAARALAFAPGSPVWAQDAPRDRAGLFG